MFEYSLLFAGVIFGLAFSMYTRGSNIHMLLPIAMVCLLSVFVVEREKLIEIAEYNVCVDCKLRGYELGLTSMKNKCSSAWFYATREANMSLPIRNGSLGGR